MQQSIDWQATLVHPDNRNKLSHMCYKRQRSTTTTLNIIALDTSGSTLAGEQLQEAKAVVQSLSEYFYQQRQSIALLCFGNNSFDWVIKETKAPLTIRETLAEITAGGGTPLRDTLLEIQQYIIQRQTRLPTEKHTLYLITDARSREPLDDVILGSLEVETTVFDSESAEIKLHKAKQLAEHLNAQYYVLSEL